MRVLVLQLRAGCGRTVCASRAVRQERRGRSSTGSQHRRFAVRLRARAPCPAQYVSARPVDRARPSPAPAIARAGGKLCAGVERGAGRPFPASRRPLRPKALRGPQRAAGDLQVREPCALRVAGDLKDARAEVRAARSGSRGEACRAAVEQLRPRPPALSAEPKQHGKTFRARDQSARASSSASAPLLQIALSSSRLRRSARRAPRAAFGSVAEDRRTRRGSRVLQLTSAAARAVRARQGPSC